MKIPLFVKTPPVPSRRVKVYLFSGHWVIESDHKDSEIMISLNDSPQLKLNNGMTIDGGGIVDLLILNVGSEPHISIYANQGTV